MVENQCTEPLCASDEKTITESWGAEWFPYVSICCATYNHFDYLDDCLQGLLGQVTTFPFEIIIRDDASTDGTTELVRDYVEKYPNIVRSVVESENQFSNGVRPIHVWPGVVKGAYIALCEGDDYWTDPLKLQKQIDLLEKYPKAVMAVAKTAMCEQTSDGLRYMQTFEGNGKVIQGLDDIKETYFHTSTYVVRSKIFKEVIAQHFVGHCVFGDTALRFILISHGPFVFLPEVVSVYRNTGHGIWSSLGKKVQMEWEMAAAEKLCDVLSGEHKRCQEQRLARFKLNLLKDQTRELIKDRHPIYLVKLLPKLLGAWSQVKLRKEHKLSRKFYREYRTISRWIFRPKSTTDSD